MSKDLKVYNGATYKLDCTITSDKNKRIMIRVVDADKLEYISEYITLEAGVPYEFTSYVNILNDFESSLDIQYGFAKINGEAAANNSSVCITVENISFTTTTYIPDPPETVITTQNTKQKTIPISEIAKPSKVIVKKVYKKKLSAKKIKLVLKKAKNANKYEVAVYKTKKNANKSRQALIKKEFYNTKITIKSNKLKNKPKLYLRARGINAIESNKKYGKWSKVKLLKRFLKIELLKY